MSRSSGLNSCKALFQLLMVSMTRKEAIFASYIRIINKCKPESFRAQAIKFPVSGQCNKILWYPMANKSYNFRI